MATLLSFPPTGFDKPLNRDTNEGGPPGPPPSLFHEVLKMSKANEKNRERRLSGGGTLKLQRSPQNIPDDVASFVHCFQVDGLHQRIAIYHFKQTRFSDHSDVVAYFRNDAAVF